MPEKELRERIEKFIKLEEETNETNLRYSAEDDNLMRQFVMGKEAVLKRLKECLE